MFFFYARITYPSPLLNMDITGYLQRSREKGLSEGDYAQYRKQLGRRLLNVRRKLQWTLPQSKGSSTQRIIKPGDVARDVGLV